MFFQSVKRYNKTPDVIGTMHASVYDWISSELKGSHDSKSVREFAERVFNSRKRKVHRVLKPQEQWKWPCPRSSLAALNSPSPIPEHMDMDNNDDNLHLPPETFSASSLSEYVRDGHASDSDASDSSRELRELCEEEDLFFS